MFFRRKSPENTTNNVEQAPNGSIAETEYPAFDPEAAERARQERARETTIGEELETTPTLSFVPEKAKAIGTNRDDSPIAAHPRVTSILPTPEPVPELEVTPPEPEIPTSTPEPEPTPMPDPEPMPTPEPKTPEIPEFEEYDPDIMIESIEAAKKAELERLAQIEEEFERQRAETEYPTFDPEAAKRRIAEYKAAHPNVVEDIAKANEMAIAEDPYRTEAADYRKGAKLAWDKVHKNRKNQMVMINENDLNGKEYYYQQKADHFKEKALEYEAEAAKNDDIAETRGEYAGRKYDSERVKNTAQTESRSQTNADATASERADMFANGDF